MKKFKTVNPNSDRARLSEMVIYNRFPGEDFNWKILVEVRLYPREGLPHESEGDVRCPAF